MLILGIVKRLLAVGMAVLPIMVLAAPPNQAPPSAAKPTVETLKVQIDQVMQARTSALNDLTERYQKAPLDQRVALEAEGAILLEDYERDYLNLVIEYHRLTGNATERERAERMLAALNQNARTAEQSTRKPVETSTPLNGKKE